MERKMLKIIPMTDPAEQEKICLQCGIPYDKTKFAYGAYEDGQTVGASVFYVKDGKGYISDLKIKNEENLPLAMILGRAVLNFLDLHGVSEAFFEKRGEFYDKAAKVIGFKEKDGSLYARLTGMFTAEHHG